MRFLYIRYMENQIDSPKTLEISSFSNIHLRLRYLSSVIRTHSESENTLISIESYTMADDTGKEKSVVRFGIDNQLWVEIYPLKKYGGQILDVNVSVNMYDLFNILDNCRDELITFWVDKDTNELVVNSFYNEHLDADELEVRLPIHEEWSYLRNTKEIPTTPDFTVRLSNLALFTAMKELNLENLVERIYFEFIDGIISMHSSYNGIYTMIQMKEMTTLDHGSDAKAFSIPFNMFYLMASSGQITDLNLVVRDGFVWVTANEYTFVCPIEYGGVDLLSYDIESTPVFIIDTEQGFAAIEKLCKINATDIPTEIMYEKVENGVSDFKAVIGKRMTIYVRAVLATLTDDSIKFDGNIFKEMFSQNGVDAISINKIPGDDNMLFVKYENGYMHKTVVYNHDRFFSYRIKDQQKPN